MVTAPIELNGVPLLLDPAGAVVWRDGGLLAVADLHLEKGSAFARRGTMLPPYDTQATLDRLARLLRRYQPRTVVCLGDSFHDPDGPGRLAPTDRTRIAALARGRDWIWITGNHDPMVAADIGGRSAPEIAAGPLTFRHEARPAAGPVPVRGEVSGHFHPKASVATSARRISGRCFVTDGQRLILPAFGAFAGGLDVLDPAISGLLRRQFLAFLLGSDRLFAFPREQLQRRAA